jgi:hypothetical protein
MYVRIARFKGGDRNWDEFAASVRDTISSGGRALRVRTRVTPSRG